MAALHIAEPEDYVFNLCHADLHGLEMQQLANLVTTNETVRASGADAVGRSWLTYGLLKVLWA